MSKRKENQDQDGHWARVNDKVSGRITEIRSIDDPFPADVTSQAMSKLADDFITAMAETDPDNPPLTDEQLADMRPAVEVLPQLVRRRGPQKSPTKVLVSIRLDQDVIDHFKGDRPDGWLIRVNAALRKAAGLD